MWVEQGIIMIYECMLFVVVEGNFVFIGFEGIFGGECMVFFDFFCLEDGKIVEYWDVIVLILVEMVYDNGKF